MNSIHTETTTFGDEPEKRKRRAKPATLDLPTAQKRFAKLVKQRGKWLKKGAEIQEALDQAQKDVISLTKAAAK